jgi:hypothetical protein
MADVAQNAHSSSTDVNNGDAVTAVDKQGNYQTVAPAINVPISPSDLETKLTDRFDDPNYYN